MVRDRALKATKAASGIIGTFLGPRSPGTAYVLLHHYMGEIDGVFRAWGFAKGGNGAVSECDRGGRTCGGAEIRTSAQVAQVLVENGRATRRGARRAAKRFGAGIVVSAPTRGAHSSSWSERKHLPDDVRRRRSERFKFRGSSGKVNLALDRAARISRACPGSGAAPARRDLDQPERRVPRARLRRRQVRRVLAAAVHGHRHPVDDRSGDGAAGKHVMSIFVQYVPVHLERRLERRAARSVRRRGRSTRCPSTRPTSGARSCIDR